MNRPPQPEKGHTPQETGVHASGPRISSRLGVCSWSLRPTSPDALCQAVARTGLRAVQLAIEPLRSGAWTLAAVQDAASSHGITLVSGMLQTLSEDYGTIERIRTTGGIRPDHLWPQNLANAEHDAAIAGELGLALVSFHAGFLPEDEQDPLHAVMVDRLTQLATIFAERGIRLALETGQESAAALHRLLSDPKLAALNLGVNFDPANMILYGSGDPVHAVRLLRDHVAQVHLKDAIASSQPGVAWGEEVPMGQGDVDWAAFFAAIDAGPDVDLIIEREAGETREADIATARRLAERYGHPA